VGPVHNKKKIIPKPLLHLSTHGAFQKPSAALYIIFFKKTEPSRPLISLSHSASLHWHCSCWSFFHRVTDFSRGICWFPCPILELQFFQDGGRLLHQPSARLTQDDRLDDDDSTPDSQGLPSLHWLLSTSVHRQRATIYGSGDKTVPCL
jgi:hypothetical protein